MTTIEQLRDFLDGLLARGVPGDTPCVTDLSRTNGFRDVAPRLRRFDPSRAPGRYKLDPGPDAEPNALML